MLVVSRLAWPSQLRITVTSTPAVTRLAAVAWRKVCGETRFLANDGTILVAAAAVLLQLEANAGSFEGIAVAVDKMGSSSPRGRLFKRAFRSSTVSGQSGQVRSFRPLPSSRT